MHNTLPSTQRYLTHYLSHTHITHWDLTFSLPEGLVVSFACLTPPIKVSILSFELEVKGQGPTKVIMACDRPPYGHAPTY